MLPKSRDLTDRFLESDPKNPGAALLRAIVEFADYSKIRNYLDTLVVRFSNHIYEIE